MFFEFLKWSVLLQLIFILLALAYRFLLSQKASAEEQLKLIDRWSQNIPVEILNRAVVFTLSSAAALVGIGLLPSVLTAFTPLDSVIFILYFLFCCAFVRPSSRSSCHRSFCP